MVRSARAIILLSCSLILFTFLYAPKKEEKGITRSRRENVASNDFEDCIQNTSNGNFLICNDTYDISCLTSRIPPLWEVSFFKVRSCMQCCVKFWMNSTKLIENENFWMKAAQQKAEWMFAEPFTDWRFPESMLQHSSGEILLGQLSVALIADVAVFPIGKYAKSKKMRIIRARDSFSDLNRSLILFSGCADCVYELISWMLKNVVRHRVTLFTRDDIEIGKKELSQWKLFMKMQQKNFAIQSTWFIMNSNLKREEMSKYNIRTFHLGVKYPVGYLAGLLKHKESSSSSITEKIPGRLLTCSSMKFTYLDRKDMRKALERNGFNCHEGETYAEQRGESLKKQKSLSRKIQHKYVELLSTSSYFASPEGNGRDCYRHIEGITTGSIMLTRVFKEQDAEKFIGLPILNIPSWKQVNKDLLLHFKKNASTNPDQFDLKRAFFPWWLSLVL